MLALSRYPAVALLAWCLLCLESEGGLRRRNTCGNQGWTFIVCDKVEIYYGWPSLTAQQVGHKVVRWHPPFFCRRHQQRKALRMLKKPRYRLHHVCTAGAGRKGPAIRPITVGCFRQSTLVFPDGKNPLWRQNQKKVSFSVLALSRYPAVALLALCLLCLESEGGLRRRNTCGNQGWTFIVCDKVEVYHG